MNLNPKSHYLGQPDRAKSHNDLVERADVRHALETALTEMAVNQPMNADAATALREHYKLEGAKEFVYIFLNLALVRENPSRPRGDQLDYSPLKTPVPYNKKP